MAHYLIKLLHVPTKGNLNVKRLVGLALIVLGMFVGLWPLFVVHAQQPTVIACFTFTDKDGKPIGEEKCNADANDIKIGFHSKCDIDFTNSTGKVVYIAECKEGENDVHANWNTEGNIILFNFTKKGDVRRYAEFNASDDITDFHIKHINDIVVIWTSNGTRLGDPIMDKTARDVDFRTRAI